MGPIDARDLTLAAEEAQQFAFDSDARGPTNPLIYFPGAVYSDAAGLTQTCANTGHFGGLDSLHGAAKMASMNVFTAADGGK